MPLYLRCKMILTNRIQYTRGFSLVLFSLFLSLLSGCFTNYYEENYVPYDFNISRCFISGEPEPIKIALVTTENGVLDCIESGYIPLGTSSFSAMHCPWYFAIDVAEDVGADMILIEERHSHTATRPSIIFLPSYTSTHTSGNVNAYAHGTYGSAYAYGSYREHSTSTTLNAQMVNVRVDIFKQDAMFLRKGHYGDFFGTLLNIPNRLPDEADNAPIKVSILAVIKGSPAAKKGLKRGQQVLAINGKQITTRESVLPFVENPLSIRSIKVKR